MKVPLDDALTEPLTELPVRGEPARPGTTHPLEGTPRVKAKHVPRETIRRAWLAASRPLPVDDDPGWRN